MSTSRRNFLGLLAAPAIVRASSLMRIVPLPGDPWAEVDRIYQGELDYWRGIEFVEGITLSKVGEEFRWRRGLVRYVPFPELASM